MRTAIALMLVLASRPTLVGAQDEPRCTFEQRREALLAMQTAVLSTAPLRLDSLTKAVAPGGALAGWELPHGHVVLAGAGAVGLYSGAVSEPMPPLLLYAPAPSSAKEDWLDFAGEDGPYRLIGWSYTAPYAPESSPPKLRCIERDEWFVHEAGWHLKNGGMRLTPGATTEPPGRTTDVLLWHPRVWDLHVWAGANGVPTVALENPNDPGGGMELPPAAFFPAPH
jgi:hypothetical protein